MKQPYLILLFTFLTISCSSIKVNNTDTSQNIKRDIDDVFIIAQNENINHGGIKVGDFVLKENSLKNFNNGSIDWEAIKTKMKGLAIVNNANIIEVNTIGYGKKGHLFYVAGNLNYSSNTSNIQTKNDKCAIVIFRDGLESVLGSAFSINVKIDNTEFPKLKKSAAIKAEINDCYKNVNLIINKETYDLDLNGESRYFKASKSTSGNPTGQAVQIGIGGTSIIEIEEKDLGRLMMFQN